MAFTDLTLLASKLDEIHSRIKNYVNVYWELRRNGYKLSDKKAKEIAVEILKDLLDRMKCPIIIRMLHGGNVDGVYAYTSDYGESDDFTIYRAVELMPGRFDEETMRKVEALKKSAVLKKLLLGFTVMLDLSGYIKKYEINLEEDVYDRTAVLMVIEAEKLEELVMKAIDAAKEAFERDFDDVLQWFNEGVQGNYVEETSLYDIDILLSDYGLADFLINSAELTLIWPYRAFYANEVPALLDEAIKEAAKEDKELKEALEELKRYGITIGDVIMTMYRIATDEERTATELEPLDEVVAETIVEKISAVADEGEYVAILERGKPVFKTLKEFVFSKYREPIARALKELLSGPFIDEDEQTRKAVEIIKKEILERYGIGRILWEAIEEMKEIAEEEARRFEDDEDW